VTPHLGIGLYVARLIAEYHGQHRCGEPARRRRRRRHGTRTARVEMNYDLLVIGGGINGAGIARDAAGRGLSVLLVERGDLAAATSSASSKLIHGGLRYLEQFEIAQP